MPTQNTTITKQDLNEALEATTRDLNESIRTDFNKALEATRRDFNKAVVSLVQGQQELKSDIKHTQNVLLAVMLAIFFFLGGILWFTRGDVSDLKAEVQVQAELSELRAQVQVLQSK